MEGRYLRNDFDPPLKLPDDPEVLLRSALQRILNSSPPQSNYTRTQLGGVLRGHTGIAYLFLQVYTCLPGLQIHGYSSFHWAQAYISGERGSLTLEPGNCGLGSECLSHPAVKACITKNLNDVRLFLASLPQVLAPSSTAPPHCADGGGAMDVDEQLGVKESLDPFPSDLLHGRAGTLYLLRLIRHWVPNSAPLVEGHIVHLTERLMSTVDRGDSSWLYSGKHYLGAAHGDIGIITQLVLTTPPLAPRLEARLTRLLDLQAEDGNWPSSIAVDSSGISSTKQSHLVQWCHGAPGIVLSLISLRPFFPSIRNRIDDAVERGRSLTWTYGLLKKEPSLCHGNFGNSLIFPPGEKREHFLALATPEQVSGLRRGEEGTVKTASYGEESMILTGYNPSAAWAWLVCQRKIPKMLLYNDM